MALYHYTRLGDRTKADIHRILSGIEFSYSTHAWERYIGKGIRDWRYIRDNGTIIELNHQPETGRHKVLLRTDDGHCAVFGIGTRQVVTMWYNDPDDTHKTLDASKYDGGVIWSRM